MKFRVVGSFREGSFEGEGFGDPIGRAQEGLAATK